MPSLEQWDKQLRPLLSEVILIGEVELSKEDVDDLSSAFRVFFGHYKFSQAISHATNYFPAAFAAWLVALAGDVYEGNNLWEHVCRTLKVEYNANQTSRLGQTFEECADRFGLNYEFPGNRYVSHILAHGGIPRHLLPEFFAKLLHPTLRESKIGLTANEQIKHWLAGAASNLVPRAIVRFLDYGGHVAERFVDRSLQMARTYARSRELPQAGELGLAAGVVDAYREWLRQSGETVKSVQHGRRSHAPFLTLDPYIMQAVLLQLPGQPLGAKEGRVHFFWWVKQGTKESRVPVATRRGDSGLETRTAAVPISSPGERIEVAFCREADNSLGASIHHRWDIKLASPENPFLAFDPDSQRQISDLQRLRARDQWLLLPPGMVLEVGDQAALNKGAPHTVEVGPVLDGWQGWQCRRYDLTGVTSLIALRNGLRRQFWVMPNATTALARLVNATPLLAEFDESPLYIDGVPQLQIDLQSVFPSDRTLDRWTLEVSSMDPNATLAARTFSLAQCAPWVKQVGESWVIDLEGAGLVEEGPLQGPLLVRVSGPRNKHAELTFRAIVGMSVRGLDDLYLPHPQHGAVPITLSVRVPADVRLEPARLGLDVTCRHLGEFGSHRSYLLSVQSGRVDVQLRARLSSTLGRDRTLNFTLPLACLRWRYVAEGSAQDEPTWSTETLQLSLPAIEQAEQPALIVDFGRARFAAGAPPLLFVDSSGQEITKAEGAGRTGDRLRRYDLRPLRDALRGRPVPLCVGLLTLGKDVGASEDGEVRPALPCLTVERTISISRASCAVHKQAGGEEIELRWQPPLGLENLHTRLWTLTRPWEPALDFALPANGTSLITPLADGTTLPAGIYLAEFYVHDPWRAVAGDERPNPQAANVAKVVVGELQQRANELDRALRQLTDTEERFHNCFEQALLYRELSDTECTSISLSDCLREAGNANGADLLELLAHFKADPTISAFRVKLYLAANIRKIFAAYQRGAVSPARWREYREELPRLSDLNRESVLALLEAPDEGIRIEAIQHLLQANEMSGLDAAVRLISGGILSQQDFVDLLALSPHLAARYVESLETQESRVAFLNALPMESQSEVAGYLVRAGCEAGLQQIVALRTSGFLPDAEALALLQSNLSFVVETLGVWKEQPAALELLELVLNQHPDLAPTVGEGDLLQTPYGWAEITRIESPPGKRLASITKPAAEDESVSADALVAVVLHVENGGLRAEFRTSTRTLRFVDGSRLFTCEICGSFVAHRREDVVAKHHERVHPAAQPRVRSQMYSSIVLREGPYFKRP